MIHVEFMKTVFFAHDIQMSFIENIIEDKNNGGNRPCSSNHSKGTIRYVSGLSGCAKQFDITN